MTCTRFRSLPNSIPALKEILLLAAVLMVIGCGRSDSNKAAQANNQANVADNQGKVPADNQGKPKGAANPKILIEPSEEKDARKTDKKPRLGNEMMKEQIALCGTLAEHYENIKSKSKFMELKPTIDELEGKLAKVQEEWKLLVARNNAGRRKGA